MHITLLLEKLISNTPIPHKPDEIQRPDIKRNIPVNNIELKTSTEKESSSEIGGSLNKDRKTGTAKIPTEIPPIYDTVEFSDKAIEYANKISLGGMGAVNDNLPANTGPSSIEKKKEKNTPFDAIHTIVISVGILLIISSLFFLPKCLVLTAIGALVTIYGLCRYAK